MKDPDHYLTFRRLSIPGTVYPKKKALLIPALRARLNWEIFYFSSIEARQKFEKDPTRYCGWLTDPISQQRFRPTPGSPHLEFDGRRYYFRSDSTMKRFGADPAKFADRAGG